MNKVALNQINFQTKQGTLTVPFRINEATGRHIDNMLAFSS